MKSVRLNQVTDDNLNISVTLSVNSAEENKKIQTKKQENNEKLVPFSASGNLKVLGIYLGM